MTLSIVDCGSKTVYRIEALCVELGAAVSTLPLARANGYPFHETGGVIISGGPHLLTDSTVREGLADRFRFIDALPIPTLGICLGHQALGLRHNVEPYVGPECRTDQNIRILARHPLVRGLPRETVFAEDHTEGIPLPPGFRLLGSSDLYPVEIMACRQRPLFGVQFHPEISGEPGRTLVRNFLEIVKDHGARAAP